MSESSSEQSSEPSSEGRQQGIPDEALPEDVRPAEDNPLADPDVKIGQGDDEEDLGD